MKMHTSVVVVYMLYLIQCCITNGSLVCTQFRFFSQQRIDKGRKKAVENMLECAVSSSVEGESMFSYNPHLRLCVTGVPYKGSLSSSVITDEENRWLTYFKQLKASVKQVKEQHPDAKEEKVDVLYHFEAENGTLVVLWYHVAMLNGDTPSAKVTFKTSVLIPDAETVCYNKGNDMLYIVYNSPRIQELFSRDGIQGTDILEARINGTICGRAKSLRIDQHRRKFFFVTDKGICVWGPTSRQKLIIGHEHPRRIHLNTHKMNIYFIGVTKNAVEMSTYQGAPPTSVCVSKDMMGLAVDQRGATSFLYTCSLRDGIRKRCTSLILGGQKQLQECMSMTAWKGYLFMVNEKGLMEFVSLDKMVRLKTNHSSIAVARKPCNIQVLHD